MTWVAAAISAAPAVGGAIYSEIKAGKARRGLRALQSQPIEQYSEDPAQTAARLRANSDAQHGFSSAENANWQQQSAALANQRFRMASARSDGSMTGGINAAINYGSIHGINEHAAQDAQRKFANVRYADSFAQHLQNLRDRNTGVTIGHRDRAEQAFGMAAQQQDQNMLGFGALASNAITQGIANGKTPPPGTGATDPSVVDTGFTTAPAWGGYGGGNTGGWQVDNYNMPDYNPKGGTKYSYTNSKYWR